jgi:hypothetical protein
MIESYRRKPTVVRMVRYDGTNDVEMMRFVGSHIPTGTETKVSNWMPAGSGGMDYIGGEFSPMAARVWNSSHQDWNRVNVGDHVVEGLSDEHYPIDPVTLEATYDLYEDDDAATTERPIQSSSRSKHQANK